MYSGTYAQKRADGRYEYGRLIPRSRCLGVYYGHLSTYSEWQELEPTKVPYGVVESYDAARRWMAVLESSRG